MISDEQAVSRKVPLHERRLSLSPPLRLVLRCIMRHLVSYVSVLLMPLCHAFMLPSTVIRAPPSRTRELTASASASFEERIHAQADKFFAMIDENDDGLISFEELSEHLVKAGLTEGAQSHVFDLLDVNRDGEISKVELRESFVKYDDPAIRAALGLGETEADTIFNAIDTNGDGQISREEMTKYLVAQGHSPATIDNVFSAFDDNGDDSISREELHDGYSTYSALRGILGLSS